MLQKLMVCMLLREKMKNITDIAFDSEDHDNSGSLDLDEMQAILEKVANNIGVSAPNKSDVSQILSVLDENNDGSVD